MLWQGWVTLAGLPENDEAVQLARLAKASGNSLESVLHFQHTALSRKSASIPGRQEVRTQLPFAHD